MCPITGRLYQILDTKARSKRQEYQTGTHIIASNSSRSWSSHYYSHKGSKERHSGDKDTIPSKIGRMGETMGRKIQGD